MNIQTNDEKNTIPVTEDDAFSYDGYQVVRGEFFAHTYEPSFTFNSSKVSVNTACIKKLPDTDFVQILVNPDEKKLAVRPCQEDEKDSFRWCSATAKRSPRQITCRIFFAKVVSLMGWNSSYLTVQAQVEAEYDRVYKKVKVPALILTVLLFLGLLVGLLWLVIPRVYESLTDLVNSTEDYINSAEAWIKKVFAQNQMIEDKLSQVLDYAENNVFTILKDKIMPNLDTIVKTLSSGVVVGIKAVMNFLIGLIVMIYLLMSKDVLLAQCKKVIYCLFSKETVSQISSPPTIKPFLP